MKWIDISTKTYPNIITFVDDKDYPALNRHKWHAHPNRNTVYVQRRESAKCGRKMVMMHREILNAPQGIDVDHRDNNGLNNTRDNLRLCTNAQNQMNKRMRTDNTSGFRGVSWSKVGKKWMAGLRVNGKHVYLGYFFCIVKAAQAYDRGARKYFGEFAKLNFKEAV